MSFCPGEEETQHFRGRWFGLGVVRDPEQVIYAVFETTPLDGSSITGDSFDHKNLVAKQQSFLRRAFVTRRLFNRNIATSKNKGAFIGVSLADVKVRDLRADFKVKHETITVRSVCVLDRVDRGDIDGHCTMGYAEVAQVGPQQLGKKRPLIRMDLANVFSPVGATANFQWVSNLALLRGYFVNLVRQISSHLARPK
jgi:hypothetical protein